MENKQRDSEESIPNLPDNPFSQYYAQFLHQGNMLQDSIRTGTYQRAICSNSADFAGKVVLDVGTGTGILAFFAAQAGAKKVYAVEASDMADFAARLVVANNLQHVVEVIKGKIEDVVIPEMVDIIISEPIGFLLVHERMLECFILARSRYLKPDGRMFPSSGSICFVPCTDESLHNEQLLKASFWDNRDFYGFDMSSVYESARREAFIQPVVGYFSASQYLSRDIVRYPFDFSTTTRSDLQSFVIPFRFVFSRTAIMHSLGCWFDITFHGSQTSITLSTSPNDPGTHWYQCRLLLCEPIAVNRNQSVSGTIKFTANDKFSYYIDLHVVLDGSNVESSNRISLHDQMYYYLVNAASAASSAQTTL